MKTWNRYYTSLGAYIVLWSLKDVLIAVMLGGLGSVTLTFYLALFATFFATALVYFTKRRRAPTPAPARFTKIVLGHLILLSLFSAVGFLAVVFAIDLGGPVLLSLVEVSTYPFFVALLAHFILKERFRSALFIGVSIALMGIYLFQAAGTNQLNVGAVLASLLSSGMFAVSLILIKLLLAANIYPEEILVFRFFATDLLALVYLWSAQELLVDPMALLGVAAIAFFGYLIPFYMSFYALKEVPALVFALAVMAIPICTFALSVILIPDFEPLPSQVFGGCIVLGGIFLGLLVEFYPLHKSRSGDQ